MLQRLIFLSALVVLFGVDLYGQISTNVVNISFFVSNTYVKSDKLKLEITAGNKTLCPRIVRGKFVVALSTLSSEQKTFAVRILYKEYVFEFTDLVEEHFHGAWKLSVSKPDAPSADVPRPDIVDYVYSIEFNSGNTMGTVQSRIKYKKSPNRN